MVMKMNFFSSQEALRALRCLRRMHGEYLRLPIVWLYFSHLASLRYKREAYRSSEFAPRILSEHGLKVVMKVTYIVFFCFRPNLMF